MAFSDAFSRSFQTMYGAIRDVQETKRLIREREMQRAAHQELANLGRDPRFMRVQNVFALAQERYLSAVENPDDYSPEERAKLEATLNSASINLMQTRTNLVMDLATKSRNPFTQQLAMEQAKGLWDGFSQLGQYMSQKQAVLQRQEEADWRKKQGERELELRENQLAIQDRMERIERAALAWDLTQAVGPEKTKRFLTDGDDADLAAIIPETPPSDDLGKKIFDLEKRLERWKAEGVPDNARKVVDTVAFIEKLKKERDASEEAEARLANMNPAEKAVHYAKELHKLTSPAESQFVDTTSKLLRKLLPNAPDWLVGKDTP